MGQYMNSNEPVNKQKSNTAIMATSVGLGLVGSTAAEAGTYGLMKLTEKHGDKMANFANKGLRRFGTEITKEDLVKDARLNVYGTAEEVAGAYRNSIGFGADQVDKFSKTKAGQLFMGGTSTKAGRITNYGIGLTTSVIGGALAIKNKDKE